MTQTARGLSLEFLVSSEMYLVCADLRGIYLTGIKSLCGSISEASR